MKALRILFCTLLLLLVLLFAQTALAKESLTLWVQTPLSDTVESPEETTLRSDAVELYYGGRNWYLLLPSGFDTSRLQVVFTGADEITLGNQTLRSGDVTSAFVPDTKVSLSYGKKTMDINVKQSANIPALFITTESGSLDFIEETKENKEPGTLTTLTPEGEMSETLPLEHIRARGNATFKYLKKPYQIKLEKKTDLFGMGKAKKWVLLANYTDYSLIRNKIALDSALEAGMAYTSHSTFVDLYINHEYRGNYLLCEKVEIGENRIEIDDQEKATELLNDNPLESYEKFGNRKYKKNTSKGYLIPNEPEDITGGYLLMAELTYRYTGSASGVVTKKGQPFVIKEPEYAGEKQVAYVQELLQNAEDALFAKDGINPNTGKSYTEYIDKDSYVALCVFEEFIKNYDANRSSLYFYIPAGSNKLYAGPVWDYDSSLNNYGSTSVKQLVAITSSTKYHWFPHAYKIEDFKQSVIETYWSTFEPLYGILLGETEAGTYLHSIQYYADWIEKSAEMNYCRWSYLVSTPRFSKTGKNFTESVKNLITFVTKRRAFLNSYWER